MRPVQSSTLHYPSYHYYTPLTYHPLSHVRIFPFSDNNQLQFQFSFKYPWRVASPYQGVKFGPGPGLGRVDSEDPLLCK